MVHITEAELLCYLHAVARAPGIDRLTLRWQTSTADGGEGDSSICTLQPGALPHMLNWPPGVERICISASGAVPDTQVASNDDLVALLNRDPCTPGQSNFEQVRVTPGAGDDHTLHYEAEKVIQ